MDASGPHVVYRGCLSQHITSQLALRIGFLTARPLALVLPSAVDGQHPEPGVGQGFEHRDEVLLAAGVSGQQEGGRVRPGGRCGVQHGEVAALGVQHAGSGAGGGVNVGGRLMG